MHWVNTNRHPAGNRDREDVLAPNHDIAARTLLQAMVTES